MTLKDIIIAGKLTISEGGGGGGGEDWRKKDGKTYLHISIDLDVFKTVNLRFGQTIASGNTIDWGDGTAPVTPANTSSAYITHTYNALGDYVITIENTSGYFFFGESSTAKGFMFQDGATNGSNDKFKNYLSILRKVEIGNGWKADAGRQFSNCRWMTDFYVSAKPAQTSLGAYMWDNCISLINIDGVEGWASGFTSIGNYLFNYCFSLPEIFLPPSITAISDYYIQGTSAISTAITSIIIPSGITSIGRSAFTDARNAAIIDIPATVTTIGNDAFQRPYGAHEIHVRAATPPTLGNANVFGGFGTNVYNPKIYVPTASLSAYQSANNWSGLASYMEGE